MASREQTGYGKLTSLRVRDFRHFRDEVLHVEPHATVLVGENDSGKTSLLLALELLGKVLRGGLRAHLAPLGAVGPAPTLAVDFDHGGARWTYETMLARRSAGERLVRRSGSSVDEWGWDPVARRLGSGPRSVSFSSSAPDFNSLQAVLHGLLHEHLRGYGDHESLDRPVLALAELTTILPSVRQLHPRWLSAPVHDATDIVSAEGGGFAASLQRVINLRDGSIEEIERALAPLFPHIGKIRVQGPANKEGSGMGIHFLVQHDGREVDVPATSTSAGLLLALAHLTLSFDQPPSTVLAIEEPENGLNARIMFGLIRAFLDITAKREQQVLLTTHNGWWLDAVGPDAIRVVTRDAAGGHVGAPDPVKLAASLAEQEVYPSEMFSTFGPEGLLRTSPQSPG